MQTFVMPPLPPQAEVWMRVWAAQLEQAIKRAAAGDNDFVRLRYLTTGPTRPIDGAVYALDSSNPNAGSGTGMYRYTASTTAFNFLG